MKKVSVIGVLGAALSALVVGLAGPAQADDNGWGFGGSQNGWNGGGYYNGGPFGGSQNGWNGGGYYNDDSNSPWLDDLVPTVKVPRVDTSVRN